MQRDVNVPAEAGHCLVDRVVDDLVYQVVQAPRRRIANIHARALPDRLDAFKNPDIRPGIGSRPTGAVSMSVARGNGSFHRLGLGSLDHCAVALAQIHCAFTSVLFARFTSNALPFPFSPTAVVIRRDGTQYVLPAAHPQRPTNAKGGKPVSASTAPFRIAGACSVLSCRIESCAGARCLSLPPWRFSLLPRSGRDHCFGYASVALCRPLQDSPWIAQAVK